MKSSESLDDESDVHIRVFWKSVSAMQSRFGLSSEEMQSILGLEPETLARGIASLDIAVSTEVRERASALVGVYSGLTSLFADPDQAVRWIDHANNLPPFNGDTPRQHMVSGDFQSLLAVRQFVDYWTT